MDAGLWHELLKQGEPGAGSCARGWRKEQGAPHAWENGLWKQQAEGCATCVAVGSG